MNCEQYHDLLSDFIDGSLAPEDHNNVAAHLRLCGVCTEARNDLGAIVGFYQEHRGEYDAVPNERALWLRISNMIEMELPDVSLKAIPGDSGWWFRLMNRSWQLSFPQLAAAATAIIILVSIFTVVGLRGFNLTGGGSGPRTASLATPFTGGDGQERLRQHAQGND